jgi:hypothetical protein
VRSRRCPVSLSFQLSEVAKEKFAIFLPSLPSADFGVALLAPDIQEAILDGRQAKEMQLEELMQATPSGWEE